MLLLVDKIVVPETKISPENVTLWWPLADRQEEKKTIATETVVRNCDLFVGTTAKQ